jgi:formylmethanofuran dehydrogenase subunit A
VQWAAGLELFLLIADPSRVFFTTDHPNGAPFTTYPDLLGLLMSRDMRAEWISKLPSAAQEVTTLASIDREYSLGEIATMTRSAPAKLLGLSDRGHLGSGATADIAVYAPDTNPAEMFRRAALVFKDGELVVRNGEITVWRPGRAFCVQPKHDPSIDHHLQKYYADRHGLTPDFMRVSEAALGSVAAFQAVPCAA